MYTIRSLGDSITSEEIYYFSVFKWEYTEIPMHLISSFEIPMSKIYRYNLATLVVDKQLRIHPYISSF